MKIKIILCICLAVCLTALGVSGFMLYNDYAQRQNDQNAFEQLNEVTRATNDEAIDEAVSDETTLPNTTESTTFDDDTAAKVDEQEFVHLAGDTYRNHIHDFKTLREINSECVGWLSIYGTTIDDFNFIRDSLDKLPVTNDNTRHCILALDEAGEDGILIDPQGYNYHHTADPICGLGRRDDSHRPRYHRG